MISNVQMAKPGQLNRLVRDIFDTQPDEISCDEASFQIAEAISRGLSKVQAQQEYPQLFHHFQFCSDCADEYQELVELYAEEKLAATKAEPIRTPQSESMADQVGEWIQRQWGIFEIGLQILFGRQAVVVRSTADNLPKKLWSKNAPLGDSGWECELTVFEISISECTVEVAISHQTDFEANVGNIPVTLRTSSTSTSKLTDEAGVAEFPHIDHAQLATLELQVNLSERIME